MNLEWLPFQDFLDKYLVNEIYNRRHYLKRLYEQFTKQYPTPADWLYTPTAEKITLSINNYSDLNYIACWAWENRLYINEEISPILLEYFIDSRHANSNVPSWLAKKLNLLSINELDLIKNENYHIVKKLSIHCLFLMKPFREFNDTDVGKLSPLFVKYYNSRILQDVRIKLRYSDTIIKKKRKKKNWYALINDPNLGIMYKQFYDYMIRCNAREKYITTMGCSLIILNQFVKANNYINFLSFDTTVYLKFTDYILETKGLSSTLSCINNIKRFFSWGIGTKDYFPNELEFPNDYWSSLLKQYKKHNRNSNGLAFSEPELAQQIVEIVYNYVPINEEEYLCRNFWLLLASCPARFTYILYLSSSDVLQPLPNEPTAFGIYSEFADKAGNKNAQFPILDSIGIEVIKSLQNRLTMLNLPSIQNPVNKKTYVHLFQLTDSPWILTKKSIYSFFNQNVKTKLRELYSNFDEIQTSAHGFRHHLLTHVAYVTGDISAVQTASGHHNEKMVREYLRSKVSRTALLFRVIDKFDSKEITGKFYLKLISLLSNEETPVDDMLKALTTEMRLDEFISLYGKKLDIGYCFNKDGCSNWLKCWSCINFIITRDEIYGAITTLAHQVIELRNMQKNSFDFSFDHPLVKNQIKLISLIIKRLTELGLTEEQITLMVENYYNNKDLKEGVR